MVTLFGRKAPLQNAGQPESQKDPPAAARRPSPPPTVNSAPKARLQNNEKPERQKVLPAAPLRRPPQHDIIDEPPGASTEACPAEQLVSSRNAAEQKDADTVEQTGDAEPLPEEAVELPPLPTGHSAQKEANTVQQTHDAKTSPEVPPGLALTRMHTEGTNTDDACELLETLSEIAESDTN